jgi:hypothetical protein
MRDGEVGEVGLVGEAVTEPDGEDGEYGSLMDEAGGEPTRWKCLFALGE